MKHRVCLTILLTAFTAIPLFAERIAMPPLQMPNAAASGFGGNHVAYTDNVFALLVNPAAMMQVQQRSFFALSSSIFNPRNAFRIGRAAADILFSNDTSNFGYTARAISDREGRITLGLEVREFPFSIAWVANGFGFALWNRSFIRADIQNDAAQAVLYNDIMLPVGFAFRVLDLHRHSIDAGFTLKPFIRVMASDGSIFSDLINNAQSLQLDPLVTGIAGGGLDAGLLYRWSGGFQAGITFTDIFMHAVVAAHLSRRIDRNSYYIPFAMNAGVSQSFRISPTLGLTLAADWRNIKNTFAENQGRNPVLDFGAGVQISLSDKVFVRVGMNEMLPSGGLGIHLGMVKIDLAYYGRELGDRPGELSATAIDLSFAIRPGARQRNWVWTRGSVLGIFGIERGSSDTPNP